MQFLAAILVPLLLGLADKIKQWHDEQVAQDNAVKVITQQAQMDSIKVTQALEVDIAQAAAGMPNYNDVTSMIDAFGKNAPIIGIGTGTVKVSRAGPNLLVGEMVYP